MCRTRLSSAMPFQLQWLQLTTIDTGLFSMNILEALRILCRPVRGCVPHRWACNRLCLVHYVCDFCVFVRSDRCDRCDRCDGCMSGRKALLSRRPMFAMLCVGADSVNSSILL